MKEIELDLHPAQHARIFRLAAESGLTPEDVVLAALREALANPEQLQAEISQCIERKETNTIVFPGGHDL